MEVFSVSTEMTAPPQEECSYPPHNMHQYQTAASRRSTLLGDFEGAQADNHANGGRIFDEGD